MRQWGKRSAEHLANLDYRLILALNWSLRNGPMDFSILAGHRNQADQDAAFAAGNSKLRWPQGKHNRLPSIAVDVAPYPYPQNDRVMREQLGVLTGFIRGVYAMQNNGALLRWGGDWDRDGDTADNKFDDLFHLEIDE